MIKGSDAIYVTAEAVVAMAKKSGINVSIVDVYKPETIKELALVSNFLLQIVASVSKQETQLIDDITKK